MKKCLLLMVMLTFPISATARAPSLDAVPEGDYRPLKAADSEAVEEGFEAAWLAVLGEQIGREITLDRVSSQADLRFGAVDAGVTYYSSQIAALTAASAGPTKWKALSGETFCVTENSPHTDFVVSTYGGIPRTYPSAARALIGLKLGECQAVVDDQVLLQQIAFLPEWRRYNRLLPALDGQTLNLRIKAGDPVVQQQIERAASSPNTKKSLASVTQQWIDEVAFQAYVLADTLDCH